jgi:serine/threonine protein kinase
MFLLCLKTLSRHFEIFYILWFRKMDYCTRLAGLQIMLHQRWFQNIVETELANRFFYIVLPGTTSNNLTILQQVLEDQGYDGAMADLWSCGVILFVLLAGYLPFEDSNLMALYKKVSIVLRLEHYYGFLFMLIWFFYSSCQISNAEFTFPPWTSFPAKRLLTRILDPNPMTVC